MLFLAGRQAKELPPPQTIAITRSFAFASPRVLISFLVAKIFLSDGSGCVPANTFIFFNFRCFKSIATPDLMLSGPIKLSSFCAISPLPFPIATTNIFLNFLKSYF